MLGMAAGYLGLVNGLSDERDRTLEDGLTVGKESRLKCGGHRGKTLGTTRNEERKKKYSYVYEHNYLNILTSSKGNRSLLSSLSVYHL